MTFVLLCLSEAAAAPAPSRKAEAAKPKAPVEASTEVESLCLVSYYKGSCCKHSYFCCNSYNAQSNSCFRIHQLCLLPSRLWILPSPLVTLSLVVLEQLKFLPITLRCSTYRKVTFSNTHIGEVRPTFSTKGKTETETTP